MTEVPGQPQAYVYLNGEQLPASEAAVPVSDRGFTFGDALVETMKLREGKPVFFAEHYQRLSGACTETGIAPPPDPEELRRAVIMLAEANQVGDGRLRLQLSRGRALPGEGLDPIADRESTLLITADAFSGYPERLYRDGMIAVTVVADRGGWARIKTTSVMGTIMARRKALAAGADEVLFTGADGTLLEGAYTNIFFLAGGVWRTAPIEENILPGIVRGQVIEILAQMQIPVEEKSLSFRELYEGTAAFATSSLLGVCPVRRVDTTELRLERELAGQLSAALGEREKRSL